MYVIAWIVLGLAAGFLATQFARKGSKGVVLYPLAGIVGAAIGGYSFEMLGAGATTTGFINIWGLLVSLVGAVALLVVYHALRGRLFRI